MKPYTFEIVRIVQSAETVAYVNDHVVVNLIEQSATENVRQLFSLLSTLGTIIVRKQTLELFCDEISAMFKLKHKEFYIYVKRGIKEEFDCQRLKVDPMTLEKNSALIIKQNWRVL